jgi:hypothetical protein
MSRKRRHVVDMKDLLVEQVFVLAASYSENSSKQLRVRVILTDSVVNPVYAHYEVVANKKIEHKTDSISAAVHFYNELD